jgi:hypothetical protein
MIVWRMTGRVADGRGPERLSETRSNDEDSLDAWTWEGRNHPKRTQPLTLLEQP